jgi:hypothetical protein
MISADGISYTCEWVRDQYIYMSNKKEKLGTNAFNSATK